MCVDAPNNPNPGQYTGAQLTQSRMYFSICQGRLKTKRSAEKKKKADEARKADSEKRIQELEDELKMAKAEREKSILLASQYQTAIDSGHVVLSAPASTPNKTTNSSNRKSLF